MLRGFIVVLFLLIANFAQSQGITEKTDSVLCTVIAKNQVIDSVICYGKSFMGLRYKYGGSSSLGFDCSGFLRYIFNQYGVLLPHDSRSYATLGEEVEITDSVNLKKIRKGDIMLFKGSNLKSKRIGHVSLVVEVNEKEILMLHSCRRGVIIENYLDSDYYLRRFAGVRRICN